MSERKTILYIAMSLDGYIAKTNDDLSFLSMVESPGEDYGYAEFYKTVTTVIVGRKTHDWVKAHVPDYSHAGKETYVITRSPKPALGLTTYYTGDPAELIKELKQKGDGHIFIDGGAQLVNSLLKSDSIDEITISIIPVLLGEGTRLFNDIYPQQTLELLESNHFPKGLVQIRYVRKRLQVGSD